jgi:ferredoxin
MSMLFGPSPMATTRVSCRPAAVAGARRNWDGACVPECPVEAIYDEAQLPPELGEWVQVNKDQAKSLPVISESTDPLETAEARKAELGF